MEGITEQRKLWNVQLDILNIIDEICRDNGLHYSLYAGSLLGDVRHRGYIPWDDDLDVCMSRDDYERFLQIWNDEDHRGYILQNKRNTPSFTQSFTKIRKDHTTFLQFEWEKGLYHTGIFVDIFPIDRCPIALWSRAVFVWECAKYQLYTREFVPPKASAITRAIASVLLNYSTKESRRKYRTWFEKKLKTLSTRNNLPTVAVETMETLLQRFPANLVSRYTRLTFEGKEYECFSMWDELLESLYGDYMKMPPEKERVWRHNHLIIDFDNNYGEQ